MLGGVWGWVGFFVGGDIQIDVFFIGKGDQWIKGFEFVQFVGGKFVCVYYYFMIMWYYCVMQQFCGL